tara:strand:- start:3822 stop:4538 length:717 start_codon:yes stop_codon:yes gene_type:complete
MKVVGIIPARYGSKRLPGKPLLDILGKSMIQRVFEQCKKCDKLNTIVVATDDKRIYEHVKAFNGNAIMTSKTHKTGTERCNEVVKKLTQEFDVVVNIQGDEPFINPIQIEEVIALFNDKKTQIGTLVSVIKDVNVLKDRNAPKAILDTQGRVVAFSRRISTKLRNQTRIYQHVGIYAYKKNILKELCGLPESKNEIKEQLEQLRWLDNNYKIITGITNFQNIAVDTANDIEKIKQKMR